MPQLNKLVYTAADYKIIMIVPGAGSFPLQTCETMNTSIQREEETIYAIGVEEPIAAKRNAVKYSGKLSIQAGEANAILQIAGLNEVTQIANATLAITALVGGFSRTYSGVNINTENLDVKAKDKQTMIQMDWTAVAVSN